MKRKIYAFALLAIVISVAVAFSVQSFADLAHRVILETYNGYIYTSIPKYYAETKSNSYGNIEHRAVAKIFLDDVLVATDIGEKDYTSYAYATYQPAMPNDNFTTWHSYILG